MSRLGIATSLIALCALFACEDKKQKETTTTSAAQTAVTPTAAPAIEEKKVDGPAKEPVATWKGLSTPESVLYDEAADQYLVSNIDGKPGDQDNKAFISRLAPDGTVATLKWIESGRNDVKLDAPKGMAFAGDHLVVADIDKVRIFDKKTGAPAGEVKVPGASFLNGMAALDETTVLVSDTGVDGKDFSAKGTDAIWRIDTKAKTASPVLKSKDLKGPNGIVVTGGKVWAVSFNGAELYEIDPKAGKKGEPHALPKGQLDGIVAVGDELIVSSWEGKSLFRGKPAGTFAAIVENVESPADIGFDTKRKRVLVPVFNANEVRAYDVK